MKKQGLQWFLKPKLKKKARKSNGFNFRKVVDEQRNIIKDYQLQNEVIRINCIESGNFVQIMLGKKLQDNLTDIIQANYQRKYSLCFEYVKNQSEDIKIFDDSKQNRIVVSMPYLIHSETEAEVVEKVLQNSINFVENGLVKLKKAIVPPKELSKIQHVKGIFPYLLYSIENDKIRWLADDSNNSIQTILILIFY